MSSEKKNEFISINDLLKKQLGRIASGNVKNTIELEKEWKTIVGELIAQNSKVLFIKSKTLHISVKSSSWLQELNLIKNQIMQSVKDSNPSVQLDEIRFRIEK